ncbi:alpha/beta hydrolase [Corynebacterium sp. L4756]|uniref:alpha/beta hydrolase n=1 Tax=unclassified Corynebacterium TaxID=2624378 RepID=UPI00374CC75F
MLAPPVAANAQQSSPEIAWEDCPPQVNQPGAECGRIDVPTYYSDPSLGSISVGFVRVPATDQAAKRGVLFGNPGGPGGDAYSYAASDSVEWPEEIRQEWDFVGVQPRGMVGSTPVDCTAPGGDTMDAMLNMGAYIRNSCEQATPGYTNSLTTENTARDWEMVRQALGEEKISIMGLSYGTFLGSTYATLYPQHTDRVVLDSAMKPSAAWNGILASQEAGYNNALDDFFTFMADNNATYRAGSTPLQVYERWSRVVAREAGARPTALPPGAKIGDLPPGLEFAGQAGADVMTATGPLRVQAENLRDSAVNPGANQAYSVTLSLTRGLVPLPQEWDALAKHITGAERLDQGESELSAEEIEQYQSQMAQGQSFQNLIICNENTVPADYAAIPTYVWSNYVTGDIFAAPPALFASGAACNGRGPVTKNPTLNGSALEVQPLQINATGDPQTPYRYHGEMARQMGAHVVTVNGPGHGHVAAGNEVVDDIVVDYLRTGTTSATSAPGLHS